MGFFILDFISQVQRVMTVAKKPDSEEFKRMFRIVALSAFAIGMIGFIIGLAFTVLGG
ncbi:MAG: protein translocase SEC61 complex subunit gamma [Candidatus Micrarchaeota archaeon]|nr:protein translocase SEC61 complex subunit gamma [Candidatus Micrarchaeota archaeon]